MNLREARENLTKWNYQRVERDEFNPSFGWAFRGCSNLVTERVANSLRINVGRKKILFEYFKQLTPSELDVDIAKYIAKKTLGNYVTYNQTLDDPDINWDEIRDIMGLAVQHFHDKRLNDN